MNLQINRPLTSLFARNDLEHGAEMQPGRVYVEASATFGWDNDAECLVVEMSACAHTRGSAAYRPRITAGVTSIEHAKLVLDERLPRMIADVERRAMAGARYDFDEDTP